MKGLRKIHFCLIFWILQSLILPQILLSQDPPQERDASLSISLDRDSAHVGDILVLYLNYHLPHGAVLDTPLQIKGLEDLSVVDIKSGPEKITVRLWVDALGSWETGPLSLSYIDKEGNKKALKADPVSVRVLSNLGEKPEEAQLRPLQGIIPARPLWMKALPWVAGVAALLIGALGLVWWFRRRRQNILSLTPYDPPHVVALNRIEKLEADRVFEKGHVKDFYFQFSEILRQYLESIRGFPAAEYTTEEIIFHIRQEVDRDIVPLLRNADLVKFADMVPSQAGKEETVRKALDFIDRTSPRTEGEDMKETEGGRS
ncbi:MAG: hypothetical protein V2J25_06280 [Desulfatiglans sp.]|jgi:hypothetical protein|nr:hypothetical protein [Desulfatiglans sp.]